MQKIFKALLFVMVTILLFGCNKTEDPKKEPTPEPNKVEPAQELSEKISDYKLDDEFSMAVTVYANGSSFINDTTTVSYRKSPLYISLNQDVIQEEDGKYYLYQLVNDNKNIKKTEVQIALANELKNSFDAESFLDYDDFDVTVIRNGDNILVASADIADASNDLLKDLGLDQYGLDYEFYESKIKFTFDFTNQEKLSIAINIKINLLAKENGDYSNLIQKETNCNITLSKHIVKPFEISDYSLRKPQSIDEVNEYTKVNDLIDVKDDSATYIYTKYHLEEGSYYVEALKSDKSVITDETRGIEVYDNNGNYISKRSEYLKPSINWMTLGQYIDVKTKGDYYIAYNASNYSWDECKYVRLIKIESPKKTTEDTFRYDNFAYGIVEKQLEAPKEDQYTIVKLTNKGTGFVRVLYNDDKSTLLYSGKNYSFTLDNNYQNILIVNSNNQILNVEVTYTYLSDLGTVKEKRLTVTDNYTDDILWLQNKTEAYINITTDKTGWYKIEFDNNVFNIAYKSYSDTQYRKWDNDLLCYLYYCEKGVTYPLSVSAEKDSGTLVTTHVKYVFVEE